MIKPRARLTRRKACVLLAFLAIPAAIAGGIATNNWLARRSLAREIANTPRDPATGVVIGTEAISIGDANAETAVLFLHGFVGSRIDFAELGETVAREGYFVRMARLPGHGTTPEDFASQTPETQLAAAREEVLQLRARHQRVYLVGFSMGASVATILAAEGLADRLVLISPYYEITGAWYYVLPPKVWHRMLSPVVPYVIKGDRFVQLNKRDGGLPTYSYKTIPSKGIDTAIELAERACSPETLAKVTCPTLVLYSAGDKAACPKTTARAIKHIGSNEKEFVCYTKRSNHHLLWDYDAEDVKQRVSEFLIADERR